MSLPRRAFVVLTAAVAAGLARRSDGAGPVTVFAASSLAAALPVIAARHEGATGQPVRLSFAASSALARQIAAGAPADIFAAASEAWMDYVDAEGLIAPGTRISPIGNRLVLAAPADSPLRDVALDGAVDLAGLLAPGARIAVGDPDHVPAGLYAREALETLGQWPAVEDRLARTGDARAALALAETGEVPLAIVYATDAAASARVRIVGRFPAASHTPITYPMAIVAGRDGPAVRAVFQALTGADAASTFRAAGFLAG